jgi:glyoxylase-like metal-dependent hydrolase (beta-lactamase superfamily II)
MFSIYLIEDVLIDAGTRHAGRRILRQLKGRDVTAHALTHVHPDHQGQPATSPDTSASGGSRTAS